MSTIQVQPGSEAMKALAHPLRVKLLALLRADGPSTASGLAERLGLSSGLTSYHLRLLADAGLIVDQPERGTARDRWWSAAHESTTWRFEDFGNAAEWDAAIGKTTVLWEAFRRRAVEAFESDRSAWSDEWQAAADRSDALLRLTPAETEALNAALTDVIAPYVELSHERRDSRDGPETDVMPVVVYRTIVPVRDVASVLTDLENPEGQ
ncbi:MAG: ArsR family transcriptional regulator [Armatimonadetes bacterium]|nr:MAG: ArsR family transcriptional regulator [Armatimonadota bacterium]